MRIIYLLLLTLPLLALSFEASPTCPSPILSFKCDKYSYLLTLFKPKTSSLENAPSDVPLSNINTTSIKLPINSKNLSSHGKTGSLERNRSFSKKQSSGILNFVKNIPTTVSQYTYTFTNKVKSMPKALSDSVIIVWTKLKGFITVDVPSVLDRFIQKIKGLPNSLPKDLSAIEQTIKGIPQAISGNIKMLGEKAKRMMTLKTVNGTTVLREKLNMISNAWSKGEQKILEKFKHIQNLMANTMKNLKERTLRTFNQIINIWIKFKESIVGFSIIGFKAILFQVIICTLAIVGIVMGMRKRNRREQAAIPQ